MAVAGMDAAVTTFCRTLRARGLAIGASEIVDALRAVAAVDVSDREDVRLALRSVLVSGADDIATFDRVFAEMWIGGLPEVREGPVPLPTVRRLPKALSQPTSISLEQWMKQPRSDASLETIEAKTYSALDVDGHRLPRDTAEQLEAIARVARQLVRRLSRRPSRRWRPSRRGVRLDLRRMMRQSLSTGGELAVLASRRRRLKRRRIMALCDVSGSMDLYSRFLLKFLYVLQNAGADVETFVFATRLSRVTSQLRHAHWSAAIDRVADDVRDWSGGTRIGEAIARFVSDWRRLLGRHTVVIIVSDGWDTGALEPLERALDAIERSKARVIWLNPLIGSPGYRPEARAMRVALPYLDHFAALHDLASLRALAKELD